MKHYVRPGIAKELAMRVVYLRCRLGLVRINSARQFRHAVVKEAHSAWLNIIT